MIARFYKPQFLHGLVHVIWEQQCGIARRWKILPSGAVELIFRLGEVPRVRTKHLSGPADPTRNFCFLSGLHTQPLHLSFDNFHFMGVQMSPVAVKALFGIPTHELRDWALAGEFLFKNLAEVEDRLYRPAVSMKKPHGWNAISSPGCGRQPICA